MMAPQAWRKIKNTLLLDNDYSDRPWGLRWRSNTLFIISTVGIGLFTDLFFYGLVVPILPFMLTDRVRIPEDQIQPYVSGLLSAYAGASVLFSPVAGWVADKTSTRQVPFLMGLLALLLATLLLYMGQTVAVLAIGRVLQGTSAAVVWTIGLALCLDTVGPENLGKTIGSIFSFISIGALAAPVLGGVLYQKTGYPGVFGIGFAVLSVDFIMRLLVIEKKVAGRYDASLDDRGNSSHQGQNGSAETGHAENGSAEAQDGTNEANEESPLLGSKEEKYFKFPEERPAIINRAPILYCLSDPGLATALLVAFVQATLIGTFDGTVPTEAQELFNFDSTKAGVLFIPLGIFDFFIGPLAGWAVDRYGTKPAAAGGYGYLVPVLVLLRIPQPGGTKQIAIYCVLLALSGIGLAVIGAPSIVEAGAVVQKWHKANPEVFGEQGPYAQLYGLNSMVFSAGLTMGPLIAGGLRERVGYGNMNAVIAAICAVTAVACYMFIGGRPKLGGMVSR